MYNRIRTFNAVHAAFAGVNASEVGILAAALYDPLWTSAIRFPADFSLAVILFGMMSFWKLPPWSVVIAGMFGGLLISLL